MKSPGMVELEEDSAGVFICIWCDEDDARQFSLEESHALYLSDTSGHLNDLRSEVEGLFLARPCGPIYLVISWLRFAGPSVSCFDRSAPATVLPLKHENMC